MWLDNQTLINFLGERGIAPLVEVGDQCLFEKNLKLYDALGAFSVIFCMKNKL